MHFLSRIRSSVCAALAVSLLVLGACHVDRDASSGASGGVAQVRIGEVDWYVDYESARAHAREVDKPLWVHFGEHPG